MKQIRLSRFFSVLLVTILVIGCKKNDQNINDIEDIIDTVYVKEKPIFALQFHKDPQYKEDTIIVSFTCNDLSELPSIKINNIEIGNYNSYYLDFGVVNEIPFSDVLNFEISADGRTTAGTIQMPDELNSVSCNNVTLYPDNFYYSVEDASSYSISWNPGICDFQIWLDNSGMEDLQNNIGDKEISDNGEIYFAFSILEVNGSNLKAGSKPNVTGNYGDGYVIARTENTFRFTNDSYKNSKILKDVQIEKNFNELVSRFYQCINYK